LKTLSGTWASAESFLPVSYGISSLGRFSQTFLENLVLAFTFTSDYFKIPIFYGLVKRKKLYFVRNAIILM